MMESEEEDWHTYRASPSILIAYLQPPISTCSFICALFFILQFLAQMLFLHMHDM